MTIDPSVDSLSMPVSGVPEATQPPEDTSNTIPMNPDPDMPMPLYDPTVPGSLYDPLGRSGNDVLSKSYLWLDWLEKNPSNTNGAEVFLLYTSNMAAAGYFDDDINGNESAFAEGLLSIQNSEGKTLVAECVDITMEQMVVSGMTTQEAEDQIDALFPGDDPVSEAVRAEADAEQKKLQEDIDNGNPPTQEGLEEEWYDYMTDPVTVGSIDQQKSALMCEMIDGCEGNIYLVLAALLILLETAGINSMDAYGTLSNELADETNQLNVLITEWDEGFETADEAQQWMEDLQELQSDMDTTFQGDPEMQLSIDKQFETIYNQQAMGSQQATYPNGDPVYVDSQGNYVNAEGQRVDDQGNPLYVWTNDGKDDGYGQIVYVGDDGNYYLEDEHPDGTYTPTGTRTSNNAVYDELWGADGEGKAEPVYEPTPLYVDSTGQTYYKQDDGTYVNADTGAAQTPTGDVKELTIGDQAFGNEDYNYEADSEGLYTTFEGFEAQPVDPNNPDSSGFSSEEGAVDSSLNALISPLSSQSAAVGAEMQQTASWIELVDNTYSGILLDDSGYAGTMRALNQNLQA